MVAESETLSGAVDDVRALCTVVELGTLVAAARQLGETKGSISRRISRLEQRIGARLLARHPRAVTPTEEGQAFYAKAREGLVLLDDAAAGAHSARSLPQGNLRLTAPTDLSMDVLPPVLVRFRERYPQISVDLLVTDAALDLAATRVDLALRASVADLPDMGYHAAAVLPFRVGLYAAPSYFDRHRAPRQPADLADHDLVMAHNQPPAAELTLHKGKRRERLALRPAIRTSDYASAHRIALTGGGITPLPTFIAAASVSTGGLCTVLGDWSIAHGTVHAISLAGPAAPARVRVFRQVLREALADAQHPAASE